MGVGVRWGFLLGIVFVSFDKLGWEIQPFSDGDLKGGDAVVVADKVRGDAGVVEVKVGVFTCLQGDVQMVFSVVDAHAHRGVVSLPSNLANLDGGNESGDDFAEGFGGDLVVSGKSGEDSVGGHGSVLVENDGRGMVVGNRIGRWGTAARGGDGVIVAEVGHVGDTKVLDN